MTITLPPSLSSFLPLSSLCLPPRFPTLKSSFPPPSPFLSSSSLPLTHSALPLLLPLLFIPSTLSSLPQAAGYTLNELLHLSRSRVLQQRVLSLQTLARIIQRVRLESLRHNCYCNMSSHIVVHNTSGYHLIFRVEWEGVGGGRELGNKAKVPL